MSPERDANLLLSDILESIQTIREYVGSMNNTELKADRKTMDAVCKRIENIGEAAGRIPTAIINQMPLVPWRKIKDMRNYLIHAYFGIDPDVVISVVREKLPELETSIQAYLRSGKGN
jgi:uncharacterized protein with HEPN domain